MPGATTSLWDAVSWHCSSSTDIFMVVWCLVLSPHRKKVPGFWPRIAPWSCTPCPRICRRLLSVENEITNEAFWWWPYPPSQSSWSCIKASFNPLLCFVRSVQQLLWRNVVCCFLTKEVVCKSMCNAVQIGSFFPPADLDLKEPRSPGSYIAQIEPRSRPAYF